MPKAKKAQSSLGKSLINKKRRDDVAHKNQPIELFEPTEKLKSVIDQSTLHEFLQGVELSARNFEAVRETKIRTTHHVIDLNTAMNLKPKPKVEDDMSLSIPRRPAWNASTTAEQLQRMENDNFLNWRRDLAQLEEQLLIDKTMTPFEKNIEVWKQLWRVLEKSDIIVQIVDGRNPLFYRCPDLEAYTKELDPLKENILLINKSDLLSDKIRACWTDYLNSKGISHIFFSAKKEQEKIDTDKIDQEEEENDQQDLAVNTEKIFTRKNLLTVLKQIVLKVKTNKQEAEAQHAEDKTDDKSKAAFKPDFVTIGMVGYPNVGKSSVINVLCKKKLVGVAAQPGKTKHFQTIFIEKNLMLCDCPGLVFPNFTSNRSEMVCNGVLPIDKLRDYISPIQYLCLRIPKFVFEVLYKMKIEIPNPTGSQVLQAYSKQRGHYTGSGLPDEGRASRVFLKDFVNGKLLYCTLPSGYDKEKYGEIIQYNQDLNQPELTHRQEDVQEKHIEETKEEEEPEKEKEIDKDGELVEPTKARIDDDEFFEGDTELKDEDDDYEGMDNEDLLMLLLDGKPVKGTKLTKQQRRDIKFALKRGEQIDVNTLLRGKKTAETGVGSKGVNGTSSFMKPKVPYKSADENKN